MFHTEWLLKIESLKRLDERTLNWLKFPVLAPSRCGNMVNKTSREWNSAVHGSILVNII